MKPKIDSTITLLKKKDLTFFQRVKAAVCGTSLYEKITVEPKNIDGFGPIGSEAFTGSVHMKGGDVLHGVVLGGGNINYADQWIGTFDDGKLVTNTILSDVRDGKVLASTYKPVLASCSEDCKAMRVNLAPKVRQRADALSRQLASLVAAISDGPVPPLVLKTFPNGEFPNLPIFVVRPDRIKSIFPDEGRFCSFSFDDNHYYVVAAPVEDTLMAIDFALHPERNVRHERGLSTVAACRL